MQFLKYLSKYEESDNKVIFYLKDYPSSRSSGEKISKELYLHFFDEATIDLLRVHKIAELIYEVEKIQYFCLNCAAPIFFEETITTCDNCNWRNEFADTPAIAPIVIKTTPFEDFSSQIAYPLLDKDLLNYLPAGLQEAVKLFLKNPIELTKNQRDNIYHNILSKNISKLSTKLKELQARIEFANFFKNTNF